MTSIEVGTPRIKTFRLHVPDLRSFKPGQHVDVRLTAPDGYQARRSYSIASAPEALPEIELAIELMTDGEVSPFFHEVVAQGDTIEVRGPIGRPSTWSSEDGGPILLIAGGSGIAPIMSMIRHRRAACSPVPARLIYSVRALEDLLYFAELEQIAAEDKGFALAPTLTRASQHAWNGHVGRVSTDWLREVIATTGTPRLAYVCGSSGFVEAASTAAIEAGLKASQIRTERFGPSGSR